MQISCQYYANIMWIMPRSPNISSSNIQTVFREHRDLLRRLIVKFSYSGVTVPVTIWEWRRKLVASSQFGSKHISERKRFAVCHVCLSMSDGIEGGLSKPTQSELLTAPWLLMVPSFKLCRLHRLVIVFVFVRYAVIHRFFIVFKVFVVFILYFIIVIFCISLNAAWMCQIVSTLTCSSCF